MLKIIIGYLPTLLSSIGAITSWIGNYTIPTHVCLSGIILFANTRLCCHLMVGKTTATPVLLGFLLTGHALNQPPSFNPDEHQKSCPSAITQWSRAAISINSNGPIKCYCSEKSKKIKHGSNHIRQLTNQSGKPLGHAVGSLHQDNLCDFPAGS